MPAPHPFPPPTEPFTWLQPGTWRKPCIVHVTMVANAERAWQRRQNPDLFRIHRQTGVCGLQFTSMGNHFLLNWPDRQLVEMSRRATEAQIRERMETVLASAHNGAITYTAAISTGERVIARKVREQGFPLV